MLTIAETFAQISYEHQRIRTHAQKLIDMEIHEPWVVDEVSVLLPRERLLALWMKWATQNGYHHFNSVHEVMMRTDDESQQFETDFEFLNPPKADYRIEAMVISEDGLNSAPLHLGAIAAAVRTGGVCCIHASFKCEDLEHYIAAVERLDDWFGPADAAYMNGYGAMSYYKVPDPRTTIGYYYLKPRVNMRDSGE